MCQTFTVFFCRSDGGGLQLKAFQFSVVAKGMTEWWNRAVAEEKVRAVLANYQERFNASLHDGDAYVKMEDLF